MNRQLEFCGRTLEFEFTPDGALGWPSAWTQELQAAGFIDAAVAILSSMPEAARNTPWIIGSARRSLGGSERTESASHMQGKAFDMSPMYSETEILSPDGRMMGLAWNLMSLMTISPALPEHPCFVVEGDHLHVQPSTSLPSGVLYAAFTTSSWYKWTETIEQTGAGGWLNTVWVLDLETAAFAPATVEQQAAMMEALLC